MQEVFISYAREDKQLVEFLVSNLSNLGLTILWDGMLNTGKDFRSQIDTLIQNSKCQIVLWSSYSINSRFVKDEATEGLIANKLIPIQLGEIKLPLGFRGIHTLKWDDNLKINYSNLNELIKEIQKLIPTFEAKPLKNNSDFKIDFKKEPYLSFLHLKKNTYRIWNGLENSKNSNSIISAHTKEAHFLEIKNALDKLQSMGFFIYGTDFLCNVAGSSERVFILRISQVSIHANEIIKQIGKK